MSYEDLKAAELKTLCEEKGIKPSRAKADMIEDLKARDAADDLITLTEDMGLNDSDAASAWVVEGQDQTEPVPASDEPVWLDDGRLYIRHDRHGRLDDREHHHNLISVVEEAVIRGLTPYGPAFRVNDPDSATWVYAVNVR